MCPGLVERGYEVTTLYAFSDDGASCDEIEQRALALGAKEHVAIDIREALWNQIALPLIRGHELYRGRYPLLCSDRYLIVEQVIEHCRKIGPVISRTGVRQ